ncbi:glucose-6-phosphate isomerase [Geomicrobium sp. JCM 19038]|uniref:glucose-6-phosphate isomerase n=1 Tax=Geomicrobium sp. JCM 19038 TaxID=1460635 RepID=UPI00045F34B0|nr:glucose-6-phosphate isomerase [Geomicrobium sp. JCM 19038]GAK08590.1 glucose-6-phosphate isomerase [Geomicrobium sp. JCM 19038]
MITFSNIYADSFIKSHEYEQLKPSLSIAHEQLHNQTGVGANYLGWLDLPLDLNQDEWEQVQEKANEIKENADVLIVVGIGGSYLGAKAIISALTPTFKRSDLGPEVVFAGQHLDGDYLNDMFEAFQDRSVYVNVISKSGTTTEPAIAFRFIKRWMEERYGKGASKRIIATTDAKKGALRELAETEGYDTFIVPDDVGGRYSVLTSVGLLPIAVAGIDILEMLRGAEQAKKQFDVNDLEKNEAYQYAAFRTLAYKKGKTIELLATFHPKLHELSEWWKQLYGESEGKDGKGLFPASVQYTTDLHSLGQYVQEGQRTMIETVLNIRSQTKTLHVPSDATNLDGLNYLAGKSLHDINQKAVQGAMLAHIDGQVPTSLIELDALDSKHLGALIYFFEKACAMSGYMLGVNPFDQPGVESYKRNMFALLGKPGYELERQTLEKRLWE